MGSRVNLIVDQGTTFRTTITLNDEDGSPLDLTSYTAAGQIRKHYTSSNFTEFGIDLSSEGVVTLNLDANTTAELSAGRYVYDVEMTNANGAVTRIVEGIVTVTPQVTR